MFENSPEALVWLSDVQLALRPFYDLADRLRREAEEIGEEGKRLLKEGSLEAGGASNGASAARGRISVEVLDTLRLVGASLSKLLPTGSITHPGERDWDEDPIRVAEFAGWLASQALDARLEFYGQDGPLAFSKFESGGPQSNVVTIELLEVDEQ